jgi:hypothetical protein
VVVDPQLNVICWHRGQLPFGGLLDIYIASTDIFTIV